MAVSRSKRQSGQLEDIEALVGDESLYVMRTPNSTRRYRQPTHHDTIEEPITRPGSGAFIQPRRASLHSNPGITSKAVDPSLPPLTKHSRLGHFPWVTLILGMALMALLVIGLSKFGTWWQIHQDDVTYGRPRTFQLDAVVGHDDSPGNPTHFIFMNLNRHVIIIEMPGGDATHARVYLGPVLYGDGQDLTPVTGEVKDVNGDGKPDLIVFIQDQRIVFINTGTSFRPLQPGEHVKL
ncbi:MAG TPA: hypothetical protein VKV40_04590 [Ktedonobacteraceae bacterium]|nr:hypothetical protein [Ktedonobacteraceae bacterium]